MPIPGYANNPALENLAAPMSRSGGGWLGLAGDVNKEDPTERLGRIYREQYEDYLDRFVPIEDLLFQTQSPAYAQEQGALAQKAFEGGFDRSQMSSQRELQSLGVTPNEDGINEQRRVLGALNANNQAQRQAVDAGTAVLGMGTRRSITPEGMG